MHSRDGKCLAHWSPRESDYTETKRMNPIIQFILFAIGLALFIPFSKFFMHNPMESCGLMCSIAFLLGLLWNIKPPDPADIKYTIKLK